MGYLQHKRVLPAKRISPQNVAISPGQTILGNFLIELRIHTETPKDDVCHEQNTPDVIVQSLDYDRMVVPVIARFRRPGDVFRPLGMV